MAVRRSAAGFLVLATALILAACSSSKNSATTGSSGAGASKANVRIMVEALLSGSAAGGLTIPFPVDGAKAAAASINKAGGIDGHMIKIDVCDDKGDPNVSAACGRTAKSNGDVAIAGSFDPLGTRSLLPVLAAEKIPFVGGLSATPQELTFPLAFPIDPGPILQSSATATGFVNLGCKAPLFISVAAPGSDQIVAGVAATLAKSNIKLSNLKLGLTTVDFTPLISQALSKRPDCVAFNGDGSQTVKIVTSMRKQGFMGKFVEGLANLGPQYLSILGAAGNGIIIPSPALLPTDPSPLSKQFSADMLAYEGSAKKAQINSNEFAQNAWSSVHLIKLALTGAKVATAATLITKIPTLCDVNVGNFYPHINFCKSAGSKVYSRVFNDRWQYFKVFNGAYTPTDGKWHDLSSSLP